MDMDTYYRFRNGIAKFTRYSSLGCFKILSLIVITITSYPAIAADQIPISICPESGKGSIVSSPNYLDNLTTIEICDGKQLQVFESAKADPIRKGIATDNPQATLDVNGGVKIGNDKGECNEVKAGTLRWTGAKFEGCDGITWIQLHNVNIKNEVKP